MGYTSNQDNITRNLIQEVKIMDHEQRNEKRKRISATQKIVGKIVFFVLLILLVMFFAAWISLH